MTVDSIPDLVRAYAACRKDRLVDDTGHFLLALRGSRIVAGLSSDDLAELVRLAGTAAAGYGADSLAVVVEGSFPKVPTNPITGRQWEMGEEEKLWFERDGVENGILAEVAVTTIASRDGSTHVEGWPFRVHSGSVVWDDAPIGVPISGLAQLLLARIERQSMDPARVPDPGDNFRGDPINGPFYEPDYGRLVLDIGCARILGSQLPSGESFLVAGSDDLANRLIAEGLPSWQVEVWAP